MSFKQWKTVVYFKGYSKIVLDGKIPEAVLVRRYGDSYLCKQYVEW